MMTSIQLKTDVTVSPVALADIRAWLAERVAVYLNKPVEVIDSRLALAEMGLDSVYSLTLCGDIEDWLAIEVEPTLAWDYPTIDAIAQYLCDELSARKGIV